MKFGNAIRKIAAFGTGMTMVGATMMGAFAADLSNYPKMFMKDDKLNAVVVMGSKAMPIDIVGAVDVAFSLQAAAVTTKQVPTGGKEIVTGDGKIEASGNHLNLGEALNAIGNGKFTKKDLPVLLADGVLEDNDNEEYDYSQEINFPADVVVFDQNDDVDEELPKFYIDQSAGEAYEVVIDFKQDADISALDDSEKITILGKQFTVDQSLVHGDDTLVLYASDKTEIIKVLEKKTITLTDGTKLEIECTDANSETDTATLVVNGVLRKAEEGTTITASGQQIYISKVFTGNIPTPTAQVEFFIGSNKIEIPVEDGVYNDVEVNSEVLDGYEAKLDVTTDLADVQTLSFKFTPSELDEDAAKYLAMGESITDPLFGTFKMDFKSATPDVKSGDKTKMSLTRSGDTYKLAFANVDGDKYAFDLYTADAGGDPDWAENIPNNVVVGAAGTIADDQIFIIEEGDITKVYQLTNVKTDNSVVYAEIKDLADGTKELFENGDNIGDSDWTIDALSDGANTMSLDAATLNEINTEFDGTLTIDADFSLIFEENGDNFEDSADAGDAVTFNITIGSETTDEDISIASVSEDAGADVDSADDADNNVEYGITKLGTYWEYEKDNNGAYIDLYYPEEEVQYNVFVSPVGSSATTTGGTTVATQEVNKVNVGAAKLDTEITDAWAQNVIAVGGPCVNSVSATLMGNLPVCSTGFEEGKAYIKLFEKGDKIAMLVAGYEGADTRRATTVLAKYDQYTAQLKGTEVVVTGTTLSDITVSAPVTQ